MILRGGIRGRGVAARCRIGRRPLPESDFVLAGGQADPKLCFVIRLPRRGDGLHDLPKHKAATPARQQGQRPAKHLRHSARTHRSASLQGLQGYPRDVFGKLCLANPHAGTGAETNADRARCDRQDGNSARAQFNGQTLGKALHEALGRRVGGRPGNAL